MICNNCNQEIPDNYSFCPNCGATQNNAEPPPAPINIQEQIVFEHPQQKKPRSKIIISIAVIVLLVIGILITVFAFDLIPNKVNKERNLFYVSDETLYVSKKDFSEIYNIADIDFNKDISSDEASYIISELTFIGDKETVYPQDIEDSDFSVNYSLYMKETAGDKEPTKIDSGVTSFYATNVECNKFIYLKDDKLYFNNLKSKTKLASDVLGYCVDDKLTTVVYVTEDSAEDVTVTLYSVDVSEESEPQKISNGVSEILNISNNMKEIYYIKNENLYRYSEGESTKIVNNVYDIYSFDPQTLSFYYTKKNDSEVLKSDYFNDDLAGSDKNITKPDSNNYQVYYYGYSFTSDEYYDALEVYNNKQNRDTVREKARETIETYSLCYYDGTEEKLISKDVACYAEYSSSEGQIIFTEYDSSKIKKFKMSELAYISDFDTKLIEARDATAKTTIAYKGDTKDLDVDSSFYNVQSYDNTTYFIDYSETEAAQYIVGNLLKLVFNEDNIGEATLIAEDVSEYYIYEDGTLVYFKDVKEDSCVGDLYIDDKLILSDVNIYEVQYVNKKLYILKDYDEKHSCGTLCCGDANGFEVIANDVNHFYVTDEEKVFFATNYDDNNFTHDLSCYYKGKKTFIAGEISAWDYSDSSYFMNCYSKVYMLEMTGYEIWYYDCLSNAYSSYNPDATGEQYSA